MAIVIKFTIKSDFPVWQLLEMTKHNDITTYMDVPIIAILGVLFELLQFPLL